MQNLQPLAESANKAENASIAVAKLILTILALVSVIGVVCIHTVSMLKSSIANADSGEIDKAYAEPFQLIKIETHVFGEPTVTFTATPNWICHEMKGLPPCTHSFLYKDVPLNRAFSILMLSSHFYYTNHK